MQLRSLTLLPELRPKKKNSGLERDSNPVALNAALAFIITLPNLKKKNHYSWT